MLSTTGWVIFALLAGYSFYLAIRQFLASSGTVWKWVYLAQSLIGAVVLYWILGLIFTVQPVVGGRRL